MRWSQHDRLSENQGARCGSIRQRYVARAIAMLILDFMKFEVLEKDFPDYLARLPARFCRSTLAALHHMKPQREKSDGVLRSWERGLLPVSNACWMLHQD